MKSGTRALGVAESYRDTGPRSTLAGAVVRADRVVDDLGFGTCTVGGTDVTTTIVALAGGVVRPDVRYVMIAGVAPAWYNIVDLRRVHDATDRPVISVTFEESEGLEPALREEFSGADLDERLGTYRRQPDRHRLTVNEETVFVRAVGLSDGEADDLVAGFTPEGGRPEPLRVARIAARAADAFRRSRFDP